MTEKCYGQRNICQIEVFMELQILQKWDSFLLLDKYTTGIFLLHSKLFSDAFKLSSLNLKIYQKLWDYFQ